MIAPTSSTSSRKSNSTFSISSLPASIFEKSRISLRIASSEPALARIVSAQSRCEASSGMSSIKSVMPMMPFIGVRISWLMFARNSRLRLGGGLGIFLRRGECTRALGNQAFQASSVAVQMTDAQSIQQGHQADARLQSTE